VLKASQPETPLLNLKNGRRSGDRRRIEAIRRRDHHSRALIANLYPGGRSRCSIKSDGAGAITDSASSPRIKGSARSYGSFVLARQCRVLYSVESRPRRKRTDLDKLSSNRERNGMIEKTPGGGGDPLRQREIVRSASVFAALEGTGSGGRGNSKLRRSTDSARSGGRSN